MGPQNSKQKTEVHIVHHYMDRSNSETESRQHELESNSSLNVAEHCSELKNSESSSEIWKESDTGYFSVDPSSFEYDTVKPENILSSNNGGSKLSNLLRNKRHSKDQAGSLRDVHTSNALAKWKQIVFRDKYKSSASINKLSYNTYKTQCFSSQSQLDSLKWTSNQDKNVDLDNPPPLDSQILQKPFSSWSNLSEDKTSEKSTHTFPSPSPYSYSSSSSISCSCSSCWDEEDSTSSCCTHIYQSHRETKSCRDLCVASQVEALKPVEYVDYFEVDPYGRAIFPTVWHNVMWREATRSVDLTMATTTPSNTKMFGPPKIPNTPSKAINNMLQTKCGQPFVSHAKFVLASIICNVFTLITMIYDKIYDKVQQDKTRPSQRVWMISCGVVALVLILASVLVYQIVVCSAFLMHALLYYGCIALALSGTGICVSGMVFFDKEGAKEDFTKES